MKIKKEKVDKELSLEEMYESLISAIEEMICTSTAVMAPYPVDVVGRPAPFGKSKTFKSKKSGGEKRAPHTDIVEEYEKQNNHREHNAMHMFKYKKNGKIRKLIEEATILVEEYINELKNETIRNASDKNMAISQAQEENLPNVNKAEDIEFVKDDIAKRKHRAQVLRDKYENRLIEKAKKEDTKKNKN